jgi:ABC-2 type transport system ATP-binding protein
MAQAIIAQPKLLILDEPFSGLDPLGRKDFRELLSDLKARGTTIFMSSHILSDVEFLCDRVSIMSKGVLKGVFAVKEIPSMSAANFEIVCEDSDRLREFIATRALEVGINNGRATVMIKSRDNAEQLLKEMLEHKVRVDSFNTVQNSLEDVFVRLVTFDESARS